MKSSAAGESSSGQTSRKRKRRLLVFALLLGGLAIFWCGDIQIFPHKYHSTIVVLDNCDDDFKKPPFEDVLLSVAPNGKRTRLITDLNICQTVGGGRSLAVSPDGQFLVACETVGKHLTAYQTQTGRKLWSADGEYTAATVARDGSVFAVISAGLIYGDKTVVLENGRITKQSTNAGFDIVLDGERNALWMVGKNIKKCDLDLNRLFEINLIGWCAVSVDVAPDGSVWVAEREHPNVGGSTNRIINVSADGKILCSVGLAWSPACLRVDRSDGSVWVTGGSSMPSKTEGWLKSLEQRTGTLPIGKRGRDFLTRRRGLPKLQKYDGRGKLLQTIENGGHALEIDPTDGSIWLAGLRNVHHYSREGKSLGKFGGVSSDQKWVAVVPGK